MLFVYGFATGAAVTLVVWGIFHARVTSEVKYLLGRINDKL